MKHIILISKHTILIAGFRAVIQTSNEFSLSVCADVGLLEQRILAEGAHIVLADAACGMTLDVLSRLNASTPDAALILWVDAVSTEFIAQALRLGVRGVLRKNAEAETHLHCLREVAAGDLSVENEMSKTLLGTRSVQLTPRERQLTSLIAQGLKNKELAYRLGISTGTVKVYLSRIFAKLGVNDRLELALFALKNLATNQLSAAESLMVSSAARAPFLVPRTMSISPVVFQSDPVRTPGTNQLPANLPAYQTPRGRPFVPAVAL